MAFTEIYKHKYNAVARVLLVPHMSVIIGKSGQQQVYLRIPYDIVHTTWSDKIINDGRSVRLGLFEGTDTDAGFIMLAHKPQGYTFSRSAFAKEDRTPSQSAFVGKLTLDTFKSYVPKITPQPPTALEFSIDGANILLQMPDWFVYTPPQPIRATMVPVTKDNRGAKPAALNDKQRRVVHRSY